MKKFMLSLMAFIGMALCFTACGDKEKEEKQADPTESGASLYESYAKYKEAEETNNDVKKIEAGVSLYMAYKAYDDNKDNKEWMSEFTKSAASTAVEAKTDIDINDKEAAKTALTDKLLTALTDGSIEGASNKAEQIQAAAEIYKILNGVF